MYLHKFIHSSTPAKERLEYNQVCGISIIYTLTITKEWYNMPDHIHTYLVPTHKSKRLTRIGQNKCVLLL